MWQASSVISEPELLSGVFAQDARGTFAKPYSSASADAPFTVREIFWSLSHRGVIRGMHLQTPPSAMAKLVWVSAGEIVDVLVNVRAPDRASVARGSTCWSRSPDISSAPNLWTQREAVAEGWNFGPNEQDAQPVRWIVEQLVERWGDGASWQTDGGPHPHEAHYLKLDISKARERLGWQPQWPLGGALARIVTWHRAYLAGGDVRSVCFQQIADYSAAMTEERE